MMVSWFYNRCLKVKLNFTRRGECSGPLSEYYIENKSKFDKKGMQKLLYSTEQ